MRKSTKKVVAGIVLSSMLMTMGVMTSANEEAVTGEAVISETATDESVAEDTVVLFDSEAKEVTDSSVTVTDDSVTATGGAVSGDEDKEIVEPLKAEMDLIDLPEYTWFSGETKPISVCVVGGVRPYKYVLENAPEFLRINDKGELSYEGTQCPEFTCDVRVIDAQGSSVVIKVKSGKQYPIILRSCVMAQVDAGEVGSVLEPRGYSVISGGYAPFRYSLSDAPDWLKIDENTGDIYGVRPDTPQEETWFTLIKSDSAGHVWEESVMLGEVLAKEEVTPSQTPVATPAPTNDPNKAPQTGDDITVWLALALCSVGGLAIANRKRIFE